MDAAASLLVLLLDLGAGRPIEMPALLAELARRDLVVLGEEHDNTVGHAVHREILEGLWARRPDLVLSLEMFERDVQGVLDDYLRGRIDETVFLEHARPWPRYREDYRPLVEFAREKGLDVIAANLPRADARALAAHAEAGASLWFPRTTSAPIDRYFELFRKAMAGHAGSEGGAGLSRQYAAQCAKDDAMAESIAAHLEGRPHRRPLVVHVCGKFHSDYGLGTVQRVQARLPLLRTAVLTMESYAKEAHEVDPAKLQGRAHYAVVVPAGKKAAPEAARAEDPVETAEEAPAPAAPARSADMEGRPALGIMPDYGADSGEGVVVGAVTPGGAAEKAGLQAQDRIVRIGESPVADLEDYMEALAGRRPGDAVSVVVVRDGATRTFEVRLQARTHR
jgi:uncharacterized iron-regulated protein